MPRPDLSSATRRPIFGASAILLPLVRDREVDWASFSRLLADTRAAGLVPAVNMDTGYANLIDNATRGRVLQEASGTDFIGGVFVPDRAGDAFDRDAYVRAAEAVTSAGGTPILFQSYGLTGLQGDDLAAAYQSIGDAIGPFYAFELGDAFADFGRIYSLDEYESLLGVDQCVGAKHSSLRRQLEWDRLAIRDRVRPDFRVLTGNDLAIDMVCDGSDYLLGLSAFFPQAFRVRDDYWAAGDARFHELNDVLQYLGFFAFRPPTPAYKHSAAMFLKLRGRIDHDPTYPGSPQRPESDREVLALIRDDLDRLLAGS